ncbi:unnamed protein product [Heterobilharzia americana]|nr:unnamed protein product [Heterobilharzia americana]CAH8510033.1 unnamed protein product [Heterobilharzia americana]
MIKLLTVFVCVFTMELNASPRGRLRTELPEGLLNPDLSDDYYSYYPPGTYTPSYWRTKEKRWFPIKEYRGGLMEV